MAREVAVAVCDGEAAAPGSCDVGDSLQRSFNSKKLPGSFTAGSSSSSWTSIVVSGGGFACAQ
jgi:hypothetical protein